MTDSTTGSETGIERVPEGVTDSVTDRARRKTRIGIVVSDKRDKTVTVEISSSSLHQRYKKTIKTNKRLHAHDETNDANFGDTVRLEETKPMSKTKRWRVAEVIERAQ